MKRKLFYICLAFFMSMGLVFGINLDFYPASALIETENSYIITNSSNKIKVDSNDGVISSSYPSWDLALESIEAHSTNGSYQTILLNFDDFNLDNTEQDYLSFNNSAYNYVLTGSISSSEETEVFKINSSTSITVSMENIAVDSPNSEYVISFDDNGSDVNRLHNLNLGGTIEYITHSSYFTKYDYCTKYGVTEEELVSVINIVLPHTLCNDVVLYYDNKYNLDNIQFYPESDYYFIQSGYDATNKIYRATAFIYIDLDVNGGTFTGHTFEYINYQGTAQFPGASVISKYQSTFKCWFGKITYNSQDYYFDLDMLEKFSLVNYDYSLIDEYFVKDIEDPRLNLEKNFTMYNYMGVDFSNKTFLEFFIINKIKPSFIAKWKLHEYELQYITNSEDTILSNEVYEYTSEITLPTEVSKTGYTFDGWYADEELTEKFSLETMPARNVKAYAKWIVNTYTLTFDSNGGTAVESITADFGTTIVRPLDPYLEGYSFIGWYTDVELTKRFAFSKMPAENMNLYGKWFRNSYDVMFLMDGGRFELTAQVIFNRYYGEYYEEPENPPVKEGHKFVGWYTSPTSDLEHDFSEPIKATTRIYARWEILSYRLSFDMGVAGDTISYIVEYNLDITKYIPSEEFEGYKFLGWTHTEGEKEGEKFVFDKMPAKDTVVKSNWQEKETIVLNLVSQSCTYDDLSYRFSVGEENIGKGYVVYYFVDDKWTEIKPVNIGTYDVKVSRGEDDTYKKFEKVLSGGFSITRMQKDMTWLIIVFYFLTAVEVALIFFVKRMKVMKMNTTYSVAIGYFYFISTGQTVHLIISGLLFLIGFVYFVHELVKLSNMANNENFAASKYDNRERFKDDLDFHKNVLLDPTYENKTKTQESFGSKYSDEDIEKMLRNDEYSDELQKNRENKIIDSLIKDDFDIDTGDGFVIVDRKNKTSTKDEGFTNVTSKGSDNISQDVSFGNNFDDGKEDNINIEVNDEKNKLNEFFVEENLAKNVKVDNFEDND